MSTVRIVDTTVRDGSHTVVALACDASGHSCSGPSSGGTR